MVVLLRFGRGHGAALWFCARARLSKAGIAVGELRQRTRRSGVVARVVGGRRHVAHIARESFHFMWGEKEEREALQGADCVYTAGLSFTGRID